MFFLYFLAPTLVTERDNLGSLTLARRRVHIQTCIIREVRKRIKQQSLSITVYGIPHLHHGITSTTNSAPLELQVCGTVRLTSTPLSMPSPGRKRAVGGWRTKMKKEGKLENKQMRVEFQVGPRTRLSRDFRADTIAISHFVSLLSPSLQELSPFKMKDTLTSTSRSRTHALH